MQDVEYQMINFYFVKISHTFYLHLLTFTYIKNNRNKIDEYYIYLLFINIFILLNEII